MKKILAYFRREFQEFHFRLVLINLLLSIFPPYTVSTLRAWLFRLIGFSIGKHTLFFSTPTIVGKPGIYSRLWIGDNCRIGPNCYFDLAGKIIIHDNTVLAPQITLITGTHKIGNPSYRSGELISSDIEIGSGVWIGARSTVLAGVKIGNGVIVAAGAMVTKSVPDNTLIGGVPAKVIRNLGD